MSIKKIFTMERFRRKATSFITLFLCLLRQTSQLLLLTRRGTETLMWQHWIPLVNYIEKIKAL